MVRQAMELSEQRTPGRNGGCPVWLREEGVKGGLERSWTIRGALDVGVNGSLCFTHKKWGVIEAWEASPHSGRLPGCLWSETAGGWEGPHSTATSSELPRGSQEKVVTAKSSGMTLI